VCNVYMVHAAPAVNRVNSVSAGWVINRSSGSRDLLVPVGPAMPASCGSSSSSSGNGVVGVCSSALWVVRGTGVCIRIIDFKIPDFQRSLTGE